MCPTLYDKAMLLLSTTDAERSFNKFRRQARVLIVHPCLNFHCARGAWYTSQAIYNLECNWYDVVSCIRGCRYEPSRIFGEWRPVGPCKRILGYKLEEHRSVRTAARRRWKE